MERFIVIFILNIIFGSVFCQDIKGFVFKQYEEWFEGKDTIFDAGIWDLCYRINDITLGKGKEEFFKSIKSVDVVFGYPSVSQSVAIVHLLFDNETLFIPVGFNVKCKNEDEDECCHCSDTVYEALRHLNMEDNQTKWEYRILGVYDSDGESVDFMNCCAFHFLQNPATVRDKDGYVNVRAERSLSSKITNTIKVGEVIYYTPSVKSSWWRVYKDHGNKFLGYVHKSRIQTYEFCSPEVKRRIEHAMH